MHHEPHKATSLNCDGRARLIHGMDVPLSLISVALPRVVVLVERINLQKHILFCRTMVLNGAILIGSVQIDMSLVGHTSDTDWLVLLRNNQTHEQQRFTIGACLGGLVEPSTTPTRLQSWKATRNLEDKSKLI